MNANKLLRFVSGSSLRGLFLCGLLASAAGWPGCAREPAATTTPTPLTEPEPGGVESEGTAPDDALAATDVRATPSEDPDAVDVPADAAEPDELEEPIVVDMTPAAAPAICATLVDEPESVRRCAFRRGGLDLPGGARADVLEFEYESMIGPATEAHLVVRIPVDEYPTTALLGERTDEPGMSSTYSLGRLERTPTGLRIRVMLTDTTYPDTGGPGPGRAEVERGRVVVTCTLNAETQYYDCERG